MPHYWPTVEPWIAAALAGRSVQLLPVDIYEGCLARQIQMWLAMSDVAPVAAAVSRIDRYPRAVICTMIAIGGSGVDDWLLRFEPEIAAWAEARGCDYIEGAGRRGWERKATNYTPVYTVYRRKLRG